MVPFKRFLSKHMYNNSTEPFEIKVKRNKSNFPLQKRYKNDEQNISSSLIDQRINFRDPVGSSKQEQVVEMIEG